MTSQTRGFTIGEQGLAGFVAWQARPFGFLPGES
jgi:ribosomal protein L13E